MALDYSKQSKLFNPANNKYGITIFGIGSVGSHTAVALAKSGFTDIEVYDFDIVEEGNIAAQCFSLNKDIGKLKTKAIAERIYEETGIKIKIHNEKITESSVIIPTDDRIYINAVDDMKVRQLIFNKLKLVPVEYIETRIGMFILKVYCFNTGDTKKVQAYETSFTTPTLDLKCGEKCCYPVNMNIASEIVMLCYRISTGVKRSSHLYRNLETYEIVNDIDEYELMFED